MQDGDVNGDRRQPTESHRLRTIAPPLGQITLTAGADPRMLTADEALPRRTDGHL
jgi:hypothetical protein